jgi:secreted PhoX family phosphatase
MSDGSLTPGIFDGMAAYPGPRGTTILIRNHENRERPGEIDVIVPAALEYDTTALGGNTKLVLSPRRDGAHADGSPRISHQVLEDFAILGGTSTNCAGGIAEGTWITSEEVVKRTNGKKHGYNFEVPAHADGPVLAQPIRAAGRFSHEAVAWLDGVLYQTEDRSITPDPLLGEVGACFYRYTPDPSTYDGEDGTLGLAASGGPLEALAVRGVPHANLHTGLHTVGQAYPVEWVPVPEPDHDDDTDVRTDRVEGFTPTRIQAQDNGAAYFQRPEGMWVAYDGRIYFDCTSGGSLGHGQVWQYDPAAETLTLIYESTDANKLDFPDNVVIVPHTGHILLQEDSDGDQYVRGVTPDGEIYDFAKNTDNGTEFCGGCFDPAGNTFYLNQQGDRGSLPEGPGPDRAVTYAIYGPFGKARIR